VSALSSRSRSERERLAQELLDRATPVMSALGVLFLLVVLGERLARPGSALATALAVAGWLLWAVFAAEFLGRLVIAPDIGAFWRRNWWQALFLLLPFLRVLRLAHSVRMLRTGRVLSSVVRSSRSARRVLGGRIGWLAAASAITVLGSGELLYEFSTYRSLGAALHAAALATVTGEPLGRSDGFSQVLEVILAVYSVAVFATLAGSVGAYFLESHGTGRRQPEDRRPDGP
jgi:voltage-gated potassium channel